MYEAKGAPPWGIRLKGLRNASLPKEGEGRRTG